MDFRKLILLNRSVVTAFVSGLLTRSCSVAIQITHPHWLTIPLLHHVVPAVNWCVDDVGMIAFVCATFGFFAWVVGYSWLRNSSFAARIEGHNVTMMAFSVLAGAACGVASTLFPAYFAMQDSHQLPTHGLQQDHDNKRDAGAIPPVYESLMDSEPEMYASNESGAD